MTAAPFKVLRRLTLVLLIAFSAGTMLSSCVVAVVRPAPPAHCWHKGWHDAYGVWHRGYWGPCCWHEGWTGPYGGWHPGHWGVCP